MRRLSFPTGIALVLWLVAALGTTTLAQDASQPPLSGHPLVGSWLVDTNADDPANSPSSIVFHADGAYVQVDVDGVAVGVWEPTGPQTAAATFVFHGTDENGALSSATVRASVEVAADGQSLTASYTVDFASPDGTATGELGPGTAIGTRMTVDPLGSPVGPLVPEASPNTSLDPDPGRSPGASPVPSPDASLGAGIISAAISEGPCTLEYMRADNMWADAGRADGDLGIESITVQRGERKIFLTDWKYEKRRNDGVNYYGSHLRKARAPAGTRMPHFLISAGWSPERVAWPGQGWSSYRDDLQEVWCP